MIALLIGIVEAKTPPVVIVNVQGVGYQVYCTRACCDSILQGEEVRLIINTEVREDSIRLFGFLDTLEKEVFLLLTKVKGVAAKSALEIISCIEKRELLRAIAREDISMLRSVKGVGKKTAERIIVELKDKVAEYVDIAKGLQIETTVVSGSVESEAIQALQALGFNQREATHAVQKAVDSVNIEDIDSGQMVKEALRFV
ncbi:MAG: Holliday junction branch migration protein RuvA [Bdellovibrionales bacterium]|nr:Holliday junction branch migration protein RuvA [Bdellovibrionales bacterium]